MKSKVKVLNNKGLDKNTKRILSKECYFIKEYIQNETLFFEIKNIDNEIVRIFPERVQIINNKYKTKL
mgnify:FL=1